MGKRALDVVATTGVRSPQPKARKATRSEEAASSRTKTGSSQSAAGGARQPAARDSACTSDEVEHVSQLRFTQAAIVD